MASSPRMILVTAKPVGMWTIGCADRLRFPRFPSKLEKRGNARLRPHTHRHHSKRGKSISMGTLDAAPPASQTVHVKPLDTKGPIQACPREGGGATAGGRLVDGRGERLAARVHDRLQPALPPRPGEHQRPASALGTKRWS